MKVNNNGVKSATANSVQGREVSADLKAKDKKGVASPADLMSSSTVNMSDRAQMMSKAKAIASTDTVDEAKVARLQKLIDEGKYKIDADAIASRIVDEHLATAE